MGGPSRTASKSVYALETAHGVQPNNQESINHLFPSDKCIGTIYATEHVPFAQGGFATVWKGRLVASGGVGLSRNLVVAMKVFDCPVNPDITMAAERVANEAEIWGTLVHPNIAPLIGVCYGTRPSPLPTLIALYYKHGNINAYLKRASRDLLQIPLRILKLVAQIADALAYTHSREPAVIHGDLKGDNILIDDDGNALLADFGLSYFESAGARSAKYSDDGTWRWMAPELISGESPRTTATDVWALGMTSFEILSRQRPYWHIKNSSAVVVAISRGTLPIRATSPAIPDTIWTVLTACWNPNPILRPSARNVSLIFDILYFLGTQVNDAGSTLPMNAIERILKLESPASDSGVSNAFSFFPCKWPGCGRTFDNHIACCRHEFDGHIPPLCSTAASRARS